MRHIIKVGLAVTEGGRILLVRKHGSSSWILPGGKPEAGEGDVTALVRELGEELGCGLDGEGIFLGEFSAPAADSEKEAMVHVRLYLGGLNGQPVPQSEIEEMAWVELDNHTAYSVAPSLRDQILPMLADRTKVR